MEKFTFFWKGPLSQWARSKFTIDGNTFNTAEQYMMYAKAEYFNDPDTAEEILHTSSPRDQKALGRQVRNFNKEEWDKVACDIVYKGNYAKYTQNPGMMRTLLATKGTTLVEASPFDDIWGIKMTEDNPKAQSRDTWQGLNWLGETLTRLRDDFIKEGM